MMQLKIGVQSLSEVLWIHAILRIRLWIQIESLSPLKCWEKRNSIRKGTGVPDSHHSDHIFQEHVSFTIKLFLWSTNYFYVCKTDTNFTNSLLHSMCRVGEKISLMPLRNCLVLGFSHFALKHWRLIQPETGHLARHRDTCMELKSGMCLAVMPGSGLNPYQILEQQRGRPLSLSPIRNLGWLFPPL